MNQQQQHHLQRKRWLELWQQPQQQQQQRKNNKNQQQQLQRPQALVRNISKCRSANPRVVEWMKSHLEAQREGEMQAKERQHPGDDAGVDH